MDEQIHAHEVVEYLLKSHLAYRAVHHGGHGPGSAVNSRTVVYALRHASGGSSPSAIGLYLASRTFAASHRWFLTTWPTTSRAFHSEHGEGASNRRR